MENQVITRYIEGSTDAEVLLVKDNSNIEKIMPIKELYKVFNQLSYEYKEDQVSINIFELFKQGVFYYKQSEDRTTYYCHFDERKIKCTFREVGYNIRHPQSIFIISVKEDYVASVKAYVIKEWKGIDSELFLYPMPNQLSGSSMCLGTVDKTFNNCNESILNVIEANYTHENGRFNNKLKVQGAKLFEYLQSCDVFPYEAVIEVGKTIGNIIDEVEE